MPRSPSVSRKSRCWRCSTPAGPSPTAAVVPRPYATVRPCAARVPPLSATLLSTQRRAAAAGRIAQRKFRLPSGGAGQLRECGRQIQRLISIQIPPIARLALAILSTRGSAAAVTCMPLWASATGPTSAIASANKTCVDLLSFTLSLPWQKFADTVAPSSCYTVR